jgi:hypothetical protein
MPIRTFKFAETSPSTPSSTVASQQAVTGSDTTVAAGVAGYGIDDYPDLTFFASLKGATGGTLDVYVQQSPDEGASWYDMIHFQQLLAGAAAVQYSATVANRFQGASDAPVLIGSGLTPALASGVVVGGIGSDRLRLVMVAGVSTTIGAPVVVVVAATRPRIREVGALA